MMSCDARQILPRLIPLAAALLVGCAAQAPVARPPGPELPAKWRHDAQSAPPAAKEPTRGWWRTFGSGELDALIRTVQARSHDVAVAAARVRQAEADARMAGAALLPIVTAEAQARREGRLGGNAGIDGKRHGAGVSASYEPDFHGRYRAGRDSARAILQATAFERDEVMLTVTTGVARAWLEAVALRERIDIGERNLHDAERLLALVESRARAGAATPLELARQRGLAAGQRRALLALRQQSEDAQTAVGVLLGQAGGIEIRTGSLSSLSAPPVHAGLPSELLSRRPDIARAEARLAAADADVAAARAAMLPSLTLVADLGSGGNRLRRLFDNPAYALAAGLAAPIFDGGRLAAGRDLALARREELLAAYRQAIVAAFAEAEVALDAAARLDGQIAAQAEVLAEAQQALALAESRYRAGAEALLGLLDAQRTVHAAQDEAVQLRQGRLQAAVDLFKAFGGGWRIESGQGGTEATSSPAS